MRRNSHYKGALLRQTPTRGLLTVTTYCTTSKTSVLSRFLHVDGVTRRLEECLDAIALRSHDEDSLNDIILSPITSH